MSEKNYKKVCQEIYDENKQEMSKTKYFIILLFCSKDTELLLIEEMSVPCRDHLITGAGLTLSVTQARVYKPPSSAL